MLICTRGRPTASSPGRPAIVVNVANAGLIEGLPETLTAEVPAVLGGDGIRPQAVGALPLQLAAVMPP